MTESDEIEEILYEAYDLGIRELVLERASEILKKKSNIGRSNAFRKSLEYWKKNMPVKIGSNGIIGEIKHSDK